MSEFLPVSVLSNRLHHVLWEEGLHKNNSLSFIDEIDVFMRRQAFKTYDDGLVDSLIIHYRGLKNSNATINRKLAAFYKLLRKAEKLGLVTKLPSYVRLPEKNARIRFLTAHEEEHLLSAMTRRNPRFAGLCVFLIDTGARIGEALGLRHGDVVNERATFWVTKSGRSRTVPLTERALRVLVENRARPVGPFADIKYQKFLYHWHAVRKEMGLGKDKEFVPHMLRHTCASRLVQAGIDLRRVQAFLGHQTIQMTLRYAHLATGDLDQCVAALDRFNVDKKTAPMSASKRARRAPSGDAGGERTVKTKADVA